MLKRKLKWAIVPLFAIGACVTMSAFTEPTGGPNYKTPDLTSCYRVSDDKFVGWSNDCKSTTDNTASCVDGHCPKGTIENNNW